MEDIEVANGKLTRNVGTDIPSGFDKLIKCDTGYTLVEARKPVCKDGILLRTNSTLNVCERSLLFLKFGFNL